jgi:hypothetical protein
MEPLEREMSHPQSPFIQLSKSLVDEPSSRFLKCSGKNMRVTKYQTLNLCPQHKMISAAKEFT